MHQRTISVNSHKPMMFEKQHHVSLDANGEGITLHPNVSFAQSLSPRFLSYETQQHIQQEPTVFSQSPQPPTHTEEADEWHNKEAYVGSSNYGKPHEPAQLYVNSNDDPRNVNVAAAVNEVWEKNQSANQPTKPITHPIPPVPVQQQLQPSQGQPSFPVGNGVMIAPVNDSQIERPITPPTLHVFVSIFPPPPPSSPLVSLLTGAPHSLGITGKSRVLQLRDYSVALRMWHSPNEACQPGTTRLLVYDVCDAFSLAAVRAACTAVHSPIVIIVGNTANCKDEREKRRSEHAQQAVNENKQDAMHSESSQDSFDPVIHEQREDVPSKPTKLYHLFSSPTSSSRSQPSSPRFALQSAQQSDTYVPTQSPTFSLFSSLFSSSPGSPTTSTGVYPSYNTSPPSVADVVQHTRPSFARRFSMPNVTTMQQAMRAPQGDERQVTLDEGRMVASELRSSCNCDVLFLEVNLNLWKERYHLYYALAQFVVERERVRNANQLANINSAVQQTMMHIQQQQQPPYHPAAMHVPRMQAQHV